MATKTKMSLLKEYLLENKSITSWEAIKNFKATRLSAMIYSLEEAGWRFSRYKVEKDKTKFVKYTLVRKPKKGSFSK